MRVTVAAFLRPAGKLKPIFSNLSLRDRPPFLDFALNERNVKNGYCLWDLIVRHSPEERHRMLCLSVHNKGIVASSVALLLSRNPNVFHLHLRKESLRASIAGPGECHLKHLLFTHVKHGVLEQCYRSN